MKKKKRFISLLLSGLLIFNTISFACIQAWGSTADTLKQTRTDIISKAEKYLCSCINENGSFGSNTQIINETAEAVYVLKNNKNFDSKKSVSWLKNNAEKGNVDILSRTSSATNNAQLLEEIISCANSDGGFGIYKDYSSDVLDSVLVLEAINSCGNTLYKSEGTNICNYLSKKINADGGWSYSEDSKSDIILTSMTVMNVSKFITDNHLSVPEITQQLDKSIKYLEKNADISYDKNKIENTLYIQIALLQYNGELNYQNVLKSLQSVQMKDGSFYNSIHLTSIALKLLNNINIENSLKINSMNVALNNNKAFIGKDTKISCKYSISYTTAKDETFSIRTTVTNGKAVIFDSEIPVKLTAEQKEISGTSAEFTLNQMKDDGISVKTELISSEGTVATDTKKITLEKVPVTTLAEINGLSLDLSDYCTYTGYPVNVSVGYDLLYAANVESNAKIEFDVTKDKNTVKTYSAEVQLAPHKNTLSGKAFEFSPETDSEGKYVISAKCILEGKTVAEQSTEFFVKELKQPGQSEEGEVVTDDSIEMTWAGPVLSDYYVYSGRDNKINAKAQIMYHSNKDVTGTVSLKAIENDKILAENSSEITLKQAKPSFYDGKAEFPIYVSEDLITFTANKKGNIKVTMEFKNTDGKVLAKGEKTVNVIDKPVQDLILNSSISTNQEKTVDLSWNDISGDDENYSYKLYRRIKGEEWESRSIWNENEKVNVLNVYPYSPFLETWMTTTISETESPAGMNLFNIDSVHIGSFNAEPEKYLYNEDGSWKYDVIYFGSADCNGGYDLSEKSAENTHKFVNSGRGVLFGHDTICGGSGSYLFHPYFNKFAEQMGLVVKTPYPEVWYRAVSVSVAKIGTLTNFPWVIRGNLTVPNTHSTGQYNLNATEWLSLNSTRRVDEETGAIDNFYLATKGNLGMIQTGDSTGQASDDERKIIANTLFYLYQISRLTTAKDNSFYDITAPDKANVQLDKPSGNNITLNISSADNATDYEYYISADPETDEKNDIVNSNIVGESALSGMKGYVIEINDKNEPCPDIIRYDETNEFVQDVQECSSDGKLKTNVKLPDTGKQYYLHVFSVDNANNVSDEQIIPVGQASAVTEITTDKEIYHAGETVKISTTSSAEMFNITGDVNISIYDEDGNLTQELLSESEKLLEPDKKLPLNCQWNFPENYCGNYTAKIVWSSGERMLAKAEHKFKVAPDGAVNNLVNTDKDTYYTSEPVNILNTIFNSSTNSDARNLKLDVKVYDENSNQAAHFTYDAGVLQPEADSSYNSVIKPGELHSGKYKVTAELSEANTIASEDTAEFSVISTSRVLIGDIEINPDEEYTQKVDFNVTNKSKSNIKNAVIKVNIYPEESDTLVGTIIKYSSIKSGETVDFSQLLDTKSYDTGKYIGVLSAETENDITELDRDDFDITEKYIEPDPSESSDISDSSEPEESSESQTSSESSSVTDSSEATAGESNSDSSEDSENESSSPSDSSDTQNTSGETDGPDTGFKSVASALTLIMAIICASGLIIIRLMGVKNDEEK